MTQLEPPSGQFDGPVHLYPVRVFFEDTDLSGVVYHANYLRWFERARSDMLRLLGIDQRAAHEAGEGAYAVSELTIRYAAPARLDDAVLVETRLVALGGASVKLNQRARRENTALAESTVRVAFVAPGGRATRQPARWLDIFRGHFGRFPTNESLARP